VRQKWLKRNFGWIADDLRRAGKQLKRQETWVVIGLIALFSVLFYLIFDYALRTDSTVNFLRHRIFACRELSDIGIVGMFCGIVFFVLTMGVTFGELFRYLDDRRRHAYYTARQALISFGAWGISALSIGLAMLYFLTSQCR